MTLRTNKDILEMTVSMIKDCQRPFIKRLNLRQKFDTLSRKYKPLKTKYIPIFRSVLNGELTMENIGMLEMMLGMRNSASHQEMNDFLAEKYKLDQDEASKKDTTTGKKAEKEFKDYVDKKDKN